MMSTSLMGQTGPLSTFAGFGNLAGGHRRVLRADGLARPLPRRTVPRVHRLRRPPLQPSPPCSPPWTGAGAAAVASTSTSRRPRRRSTSSPRPSSTTPSTAPTRRAGATRIRSSRPTASTAAPATTAGWRSPARPTSSGGRWPGEIGGLTDDDVEAWTATRDIAEVEKALQASGVPVHGVQNSAECWTDPQLQHRATSSPSTIPCTSSCVVEGPRLRALAHARRRAAHRTVDGRAQRPSSCGELLGYDDDRIADLAIAGALG